MLQTSLTNQTK